MTMTDMTDPAPGVEGISIDSDRPVPRSERRKIEDARIKALIVSIGDAITAMLPEHAHHIGGFKASLAFVDTWKWSTPLGVWHIQHQHPGVFSETRTEAGTLNLSALHRDDVSAALPASMDNVAVIRRILVALEAIDDV